MGSLYSAHDALVGQPQPSSTAALVGQPQPSSTAALVGQPKSQSLAAPITAPRKKKHMKNSKPATGKHLIKDVMKKNGAFTRAIREGESALVASQKSLTNQAVAVAAAGADEMENYNP
jgi:hypothetical protein